VTSSASMSAEGGCSGLGGGCSGGAVGGGGDGAVRKARPTEACTGAHASSATPWALLTCVVEREVANDGENSRLKVTSLVVLTTAVTTK
jgi:hypothetical protein